jgi:hypothetical protein
VQPTPISSLTVPLNLDKSFWQPAGNQQLPAPPDPSADPLELLGPAIILTPLKGLPTGSTCTIVFSDSVVDKEGNLVCAPPLGEVTSPCTPGDTSLISWGVDVLQIDIGASAPNDGAVNVGRTTAIVEQFNAELKASTLVGVTLKKGATNVTIAPVVAGANRNQILIMNPALDANSVYTLTIPTTVTDILGGAVKAPIVITFTTGA